jgi:predicted nucleic acid-binding protein
MKFMTENSKSFVDSNIWLYNFISTQNAQKSQRAKDLIKNNKNIICLSTQVVNEVCFNLKRKENFDEIRLKQIITRFYFDYEIIELDKKILLLASDLRSRYPFSFWDGLIAASALWATAEILYSEDMQNGLLVENKLKIINPFEI